MATIITKNSSTASSVPSAAQLTAGELAVNLSDKRLFSKTAGGTVIEVGTNPSTLALPNGTANGIPYLNGSKVLTTGSALTFDGTKLSVGGSAIEKITTDGNIASTAAQAYIYSNGGSGSSVNAGFLLSGSDNTVRFYAANSEQMRLTSTGLGIGTSTIPTVGSTTVLAVGAANGGTHAITQSGSIVYRTSASTSGVDFYNPNSSPMQWYTAGTSRMLLDSSGNLGLGVTPSAWLSSQPSIQIKGGSYFATSGQYAFFTANTYLNGSGVETYISNGAATKYTHAVGQHQWHTAPSGTAGNAITFTQAMTLDASGNLLVGTTSTAAYFDGKLNVDGRIHMRVSSENDRMYLQNTASSGTRYFLTFIVGASTLVGNITSDGTSTTYGTSSDYRLKYNIAPMTGALAKVAALKPCTYKWKADGSDGEGFIAHELQEVVPQCVTGEKDAVDADGNPQYQGIDTSFLVATLTAAIQEQQAIINALTTRIEALEAK